MGGGVVEARVQRGCGGERCWRGWGQSTQSSWYTAASHYVEMETGLIETRMKIYAVSGHFSQVETMETGLAGFPHPKPCALLMCVSRCVCVYMYVCVSRCVCMCVKRLHIRVCVCMTERVRHAQTYVFSPLYLYLTIQLLQVTNSHSSITCGITHSGGVSR